MICAQIEVRFPRIWNAVELVPGHHDREPSPRNVSASVLYSDIVPQIFVQIM